MGLTGTAGESEMLQQVHGRNVDQRRHVLGTSGGNTMSQAAAMDTATYPLFRAPTAGGFQSTHSHNNTWISVQV